MAGYPARGAPTLYTSWMRGRRGPSVASFQPGRARHDGSWTVTGPLLSGLRASALGTARLFPYRRAATAGPNFDCRHRSTLVWAKFNKGGGGGGNPSYHIWALLLPTHLASWLFFHLSSPKHAPMSQAPTHRNQRYLLLSTALPDLSC